MRHSMTGAAVLDLLALLEAHMLASNLCKASMKLIWQFFSKMRHKAVTMITALPVTLTLVYQKNNHVICVRENLPATSL